MASGKSVDQYDPFPPIQVLRGQGDAVFLLLIGCVYMPCNGKKDNYHPYIECIEQLQDIIYTYQGTHKIIIGGDFNENVLVKNNTKRITLQRGLRIINASMLMAKILLQLTFSYLRKLWTRIYRIFSG